MAVTAEFNLDSKAFQKLMSKYGEDTVTRAAKVARTYTQKVTADAKQILTNKGHVNSGATRNRINDDIKAKGGEIIGEVRGGTNYTRFIHEGVKHQGNAIVPMFVSFKVAPSLLQWAIRKGVIQQVTKTGKVRKATWAGRDKVQKWVITKSGKPINIQSGGLRVMIQPAKFFEKPFKEHAPKFEADIKKAVLE